MASKIASKVSTSQAGGTTMGTTRTQGASTQGGTILGIGLGTALDGASNVSAATSRPTLTYQSTRSGGGTARSSTQGGNVSFMSILATSVRSGRQKISRVRDAKGRKAVLIGCCCGLFLSMMMGAATLLVIGIMLGVDIKYSNLIIDTDERPVIAKVSKPCDCWSVVSFPPGGYPSVKDTLALLPNLTKFCQLEDPCAFYRRTYADSCRTIICKSILPEVEFDGEYIVHISTKNRDAKQVKTPPMSPCEEGGLPGLCVQDKCMTTLSQDDPLKKGDPNYESSILRDYQRISLKEVIGGWRLLPELPQCDMEPKLSKKLYAPCDGKVDYTVGLKVCDSPFPQYTNNKYCGNIRDSKSRLPFSQYPFVLKLCPGKKYTPDEKLDCSYTISPTDVITRCTKNDFKACCFITEDDSNRIFGQGLCFMGLCLTPPQ